MKLLEKRNQNGFTIIEVMIVLAIAGVIMLALFLAVPALQRNNRNTQRKNDAARASSLIAEFSTNNNGKVPTTITTTGASTATNLTIPVSSLTQYDAVVHATVPGSASASLDTLVAVFGSRCQDNALVSAGSRAYAVTFNIEKSDGTPQFQCI